MDRSERYDRQLRIWGQNAQSRLEKAHVCVINASALGTETLKNLVLPGIGAFTLIDGEDCSTRDLGQNFFVTQEQVTKKVKRAEAASMLLRDLNDAVQGNHITEGIDEILQQTDDAGQFFGIYSLVVCTGMSYGPALERVASACRSADVPLIICRIHGFFGLLRIVAEEHCIENSREGEDTKLLHNLCLSDPFPELVEFADTFDLDALEDTLHGHVPFAVLIVKAVKHWQKGAAEAQVVTREQLEQVRDILRSWRRSESEENFDEAIRKAYLARAGAQVSIDASIRELEATRKAGDEGPFWLLCEALVQFSRVDGNGRPPVRAKLPDMVSDTGSYVKLQGVYQARADRDLEKVALYAKHAAEQRGLETPSDDELRQFCAQAAFLQVQRTRSLEEELRSHTPSLAGALSDGASSAWCYVFMRALDRFSSKHLRPTPELGEECVAQLRAEVHRVLANIGISGGSTNVKDEALLEFIGYHGSEPHAMAAMLAGVVSQECVKVLARQFVPVSNTLIVDGARASSLALEL